MAGFEGDLCETNIDDCVEHECANDGVCIDEIDGYSCQCSEKYVSFFDPLYYLLNISFDTPSGLTVIFSFPLDS